MILHDLGIIHGIHKYLVVDEADRDDAEMIKFITNIVPASRKELKRWNGVYRDYIKRDEFISTEDVIRYITTYDPGIIWQVEVETTKAAIFYYFTGLINNWGEYKKFTAETTTLSTDFNNFIATLTQILKTLHPDSDWSHVKFSELGYAYL